jgi:hypothetical protein
MWKRDELCEASGPCWRHSARRLPCGQCRIFVWGYFSSASGPLIVCHARRPPLPCADRPPMVQAVRRHGTHTVAHRPNALRGALRLRGGPLGTFFCLERRKAPCEMHIKLVSRTPAGDRRFYLPLPKDWYSKTKKAFIGSKSAAPLKSDSDLNHRS